MSERIFGGGQASGEARVPPLSTLVNLKKLTPGGAPESFIVERHFLEMLLAPLIATIFVDEKWYLDKYPDVRASIRSGTVSSAKDHYTRFGYFEHRMPYAIHVNEAWYLAQYPDVRACVTREDLASAQEHFEIFGFKEGRMPFGSFSFRRA